MNSHHQSNYKRSKTEKKFLRKQMKARHTLLRHEGIETVSYATQSLVVANGGLGNSVSRKQLLPVLEKCGFVDALLMPPNKPYSFVRYRTTEESKKAYDTLSGKEIVDDLGQKITLYLNFVEKAPWKELGLQALPPGLMVIEEIISSEDEKMLLESVNWTEDTDNQNFQKSLKHRRVKHFGYEFQYENNNVDKDKPLPGGLPDLCDSILEKWLKEGFIKHKPDQLTVNQYEPGQGIPAHIDTHSAFEDEIISLSLGSEVVMDFKHPDGVTVPVMLPCRSLLVMTGESRYLWTHGITPRKFDTVQASRGHKSGVVTGDVEDLTLSKRGIRTSFTFRKVRHTPCNCRYSLVCDSQTKETPPSFPESDREASRLEQEYVHRVYEGIAGHFSSTRHTPWPRVVEFLKALPSGSVVADIGCGNGKYLGVNKELYTIGCDRSQSLVDICRERRHQAVVCDARAVPVRSGSCDACVSIAVIHHFATAERRAAALRELVRLLRPGGKALIYVWAMEQEHGKKKSKYLRENRVSPGREEQTSKETLAQEVPAKHTPDMGSQDSARPVPSISDFQEGGCDSRKATSSKLPVHTNRTPFHSQDLLVPWHLTGNPGKDRPVEPLGALGSGDPGAVFHRYYHVFREAELEAACRSLSDVSVLQSYYDQGNWCVILQKAKANYEREERRKELKRLRGEDTWMLPDVNERVEQISQEHSVKKKKKKDKHSKKVKKEKKKKSKKQKYEKNNESTDSSSSSEDEWVEAVPSQTSGKEKAWKVKDEKLENEDNQFIQRDEWMTVDFMSVKTVSSSSLKAEKETLRKIEREKTQALEQSRLLERELNPYWKDGGTGLPPEDCSVPSVTKVEDGGLSWLRKSYQRMKEQAEKQNRNFEDVVAERYGSVEAFQLKLKEAEKTAFTKEDCRRERWRKPTCSERTQSSQESRKSYLVKYNKSSRDRYSVTDTANNVNKDRFSDVEKDNRSGFLETCRKESNPRQKQEFSSLGNLRPKFLRPSDDEELSFHSKSRNFEPSSSSSALVAQNSVHCGFRKPTESSEESLSSWSGSDGRERDWKHPNRKELDMSRNVEHGHVSEDVREESQDESLRDDSLKKEHLQDTESSLAGSSPVDDSIHILSVDEKNKLGAKIIKAEMMGNMELAEQLKAQLDKANKFKETVTQISSKKSGVENEDKQEVVLVRTDQSGRVWPVTTPGKHLESKGGRRKRQIASTHEEKERVRYFHDDDNLSLNDLVKNEKMGTAENQNKLFMRMASKFMGKTDGDYYTLDDMFVSKAAERECFGEGEESQKKKAIAEHRSLAAQMEKCLYCFDSSRFPKHLIVAIGVKVYLCLPNIRSLTDGQCLIVPLQHHRAATSLDEDIWEEMQMFRKSLVKMFEDKGLDCIFLETNMSMKKQYHMVYECVPLPKEVGDMAPIYFKKAIMESDEEWSMNKKLIDLSSKDIRKSVPRGLPYFSVNFGLQGGFAHVIEDQHKFPHYFGKEIIGGMLDIEPRLWRKGIQESFEDQRKKALQFAQWWKPFDFTRSKNC
ncbi:CWF19-like protein 2 isoform X3 [Camelus ferus]|uniref:CWF19-like protein 2 n=1 Tax=Camelus ferus TaxID=419612 RepID=A0A8B8SF42_CAMFR|nr:CWF19-like protein 2 isoform X3 [Camelus ferus]